MSTNIESYLAMFRFQGWLFHDVTLAVVYVLSALFGVLLFLMTFRRKKPEKLNYSYQKSAKESLLSFPTIVSFFLTWLLFFALLSHFALFVFGAGMSRNDLSVDSAGFVTEDQLVVNKWRRTVKKGKNTGVSHFQINALDLKTGHLAWQRASTEEEAIIGQTTVGMVLLNRQTAEVSLVNERTGKERLSSQEIAETFPEMEANWSKLPLDYLVGDDSLYVHGLDGHYYQLGLSAKGVVKGMKWAKVFEQRQKSMDCEPTLIEALTEEIGETYLDGKLLPIEDSTSFFIRHSQKADDTSLLISAVTREQPEVVWQARLRSQLSKPVEAETGFDLNSQEFFYTTAGFSFVLDKRDGGIALKFDQAYNRELAATD